MYYVFVSMIVFVCTNVYIYIYVCYCVYVCVRVLVSVLQRYITLSGTSVVVSHFLNFPLLIISHTAIELACIGCPSTKHDTDSMSHDELWALITEHDGKHNILTCRFVS